MVNIWMNMWVSESSVDHLCECLVGPSTGSTRCTSNGLKSLGLASSPASHRNLQLGVLPNRLADVTPSVHRENRGFEV